MSMARATVSGILTADPEKRFTANNVEVTVLTLSVAQPVRRLDQSEEASQFSLRALCWRTLASQAATLRKGEAVLLEGKLQLASISGPDGAQKKQFEMEANVLHVLPGGLPQQMASNASGGQQPSLQSASGGVAGPGYQAPSSGAQQHQPPAGTSPSLSSLPPDDFITEDDIPF